ncbi:MAG: class I SAM-dependent methyltransferase [Calditrichaeota bacterium]|nr:class I SAM-dependent methyltransferase [Calditrichota bacterium]MCB0267211.1 class I SAM-dependent methyltransferase [Calditrichota bacterium]
MNTIFRRIAKFFVSLLLMLWSFTIGLFTPKGQYIHSLICRYFGFVFDKPKLPLIEQSAFLSDTTVQLTELQVQPGNMSVDEMSTIAAIVKKFQPKRIFEIGTMNGRTTLNMALNAPDDCEIFTLDLPADAAENTKFNISKRYLRLVDKAQSGELFANKSAIDFPCIQLIKQLYGDSGTFDFSRFENSIDVVFIDGSHDFDYVLNDSEIALKLLRNGKGIILWHDYRPEIDVVPALEVFRKRHPEIEISHIRDTTFAFASL